MLFLVVMGVAALIGTIAAVLCFREGKRGQGAIMAALVIVVLVIGGFKLITDKQVVDDVNQKISEGWSVTINGLGTELPDNLGGYRISFNEAEKVIVLVK